MKRPEQYSISGSTGEDNTVFLSSTKPPSCHMCDDGGVAGGDEAAMLLGGTVVAVVVLMSTVLGDFGQFT